MTIGAIRCFLRRRHDWGPWAHDPDNLCHIFRFCRSCHIPDSDTNHDLGNWQYPLANQCNQTRRCQRPRCLGFEKRTVHPAFELTAVGGRPCDIIEECVRCGHQHLVETRHEFKDAVCIHCGETEIIPFAIDRATYLRLNLPDYP